jgi:hypothetical protein
MINNFRIVRKGRYKTIEQFQKVVNRNNSLIERITSLELREGKSKSELKKVRERFRKEQSKKKDLDEKIKDLELKFILLNNRESNTIEKKVSERTELLNKKYSDKFEMLKDKAAKESVRAAELQVFADKQEHIARTKIQKNEKKMKSLQLEVLSLQQCITQMEEYIKEEGMKKFCVKTLNKINKK